MQLPASSVLHLVRMLLAQLAWGAVFMCTSLGVHGYLCSSARAESRHGLVALPADSC